MPAGKKARPTGVLDTILSTTLSQGTPGNDSKAMQGIATSQDNCPGDSDDVVVTCPPALDHGSKQSDIANEEPSLREQMSLIMDMLNKVVPVVSSLQKDKEHRDAQARVVMRPEVEAEDETDEECEYEEIPAKRTNLSQDGLKTAATTSSRLDSLLTEFAGEEDTSEMLPEKIARLLTNVLSQGLKGTTLKDIIGKTKRPFNCQQLALTKVNTEIWDIASKQSRQNDSRLQATQEILVAGLIPLAKLAGKVGEAIDANERPPPMEEIWEQLSSSLVLVASANHSLNISRREMFRTDVDSDFKSICGDSYPVESTLFGRDLGDRLKTVTESRRASKQLSKSETTLPPSQSNNGKPFLWQKGRYQRPTTSYSKPSGSSYSGRRQHFRKDPQRSQATKNQRGKQ